MNTKLVINNFSIMIYFSRLSLSVAAEYKHYYYIYVSTRLDYSHYSRKSTVIVFKLGSAARSGFS